MANEPRTGIDRKTDRAGEAAPVAGGAIEATRFAAASALLVEALWPTLFRLTVVAGIFLGLAWFGVFANVGDILRFALLAILGGGALFVLWGARGIRLPDRAAVERRIEAASLLDHQPLRVQSDRALAEDPFSQALWREHQRRMAERLFDLSGGTPRTRTERLDPYGLRAVLAVLLLTAFAYSHGSNGGRLADAFTPPVGEAVAAARVDAWVTPPAYTGRAPVFLTEPPAGNENASIEVPQGSVLSVRVSESAGALLTFTPAGADQAVKIDAGLPEKAPDNLDADAVTKGAASAGAGEYEFALATSGAARLATTFATLGDWRFDVVPDKSPTIEFSTEPTAARNGSLELAYAMSDDYGVREGRAEIEVIDDIQDAVRPLVPAPVINLAMPRKAKGEVKGRTAINLTESPYAGARVRMTLVALDDAGQVGRSKPKEFVLPERAFSNPLARAVVEQRRILALNGNAAQRVVDMLDAVTIRDGEFIEKPADYLALRAARTRIATATSDEMLLSAVDFLWQIALGIEDGNLSLAEKKLGDARENLAEALEKGASDAEIDKLMAELRQAMQDYMQSMAEAMKNMPPMSQKDMQAGNMQELRPQDIDKMLDRIEDLAKSGSKDAAKELLSELQSMMDNLQAMQQPGQQPPQSGEQSAMQQQMDKMSEMLRRQQELKDRTFDLGREQARREQEGEQEPGDPSQQGQPQAGENGEPQAGGGQRPMTAEELNKALQDLQAKQGQLQKELQEMQEAMKGMGLQPGKGLGEAGEAMGRAKGALGEGNDGEAVGQQGQAMEALRRGAQDMMNQMQQAMQAGQGQQGQQGQMGQGYGRGEQRSGRDPLGRPRSTEGMDFGQDVRVPDEIDTQRARRILDTIRSRLGNSLSPQLEREYLERLLKTP